MQTDFPLLSALLLVAAAWYGSEMLLARAAGWPLTFAYPLYAAMRDLMLPLLWINGWLGSDFVWRGKPGGLPGVFLLGRHGISRLARVRCLSPCGNVGAPGPVRASACGQTA